MTRVSNGTELATRLLQAVRDLQGMSDARQVARYTVALTREIVPHVDLIALHVANPVAQEFMCLGVFGAPHYGDTLHTPFNSYFGKVLSTRMPLWLKTPGEVRKIYGTEDDGTSSFARHSMIHRSVIAQPNRNVVLQPCIVNGDLVGVLWLETWESQRFSKWDIERIELISQVAAMSVTECTIATVHDSTGLSREIALGSTLQERHEEPEAEAALSSHKEHKILVPQPNADIKLTEREKTVLLNLVTGLTNAEIAQEMFISINTVRSHRRSLMAKLDAHSSTELIFNARNYGLIS